MASIRVLQLLRPQVNRVAIFSQCASGSSTAKGGKKTKSVQGKSAAETAVQKNEKPKEYVITQPKTENEILASSKAKEEVMVPPKTENKVLASAPVEKCPFPQDKKSFDEYLKTYKVQEYYGYHEDSYLDFEVEMSKYRLKQPSSL